MDDEQQEGAFALVQSIIILLSCCGVAPQNLKSGGKKEKIREDRYLPLHAHGIHKKGGQAFLGKSTKKKSTKYVRVFWECEPSISCCSAFLGIHRRKKKFWCGQQTAETFDLFQLFLQKYAHDFARFRNRRGKHMW